MQAELERLVELQRADLRLLELFHQTELFPQRQQEAEGQLAVARQALEQARRRHTESLKERKQRELDVQQLEEKIDKHKAQLYEVKSNEAYRTLQHEIEEEEKRKAAAEDQELEAMLAVEELEKEIKKDEAALQEVEQRVAAALAELEAEKAKLEKEAAELRARRDSLRSQVDDEMLEMYDHIARGHGGIGVAEARDEVCQVCLIHIRPQTFAEVKRGSKVHTCESCHRILYYRQPVEAAAPEGQGGVPAGQAGPPAGRAG